MFRHEVFALTLAALAALVVGLAWLFGPLVLLAATVAIGAFVLFVNMKE